MFLCRTYDIILRKTNGFLWYIKRNSSLTVLWCKNCLCNIQFQFAHSLTRSPTNKHSHPPTQPLTTHPPTHSLINHSPTNPPLTHSLIHPPSHSLIHSPQLHNVLRLQCVPIPQCRLVRNESETEQWCKHRSDLLRWHYTLCQGMPLQRRSLCLIQWRFCWASCRSFPVWTHPNLCHELSRCF